MGRDREREGRGKRSSIGHKLAKFDWRGQYIAIILSHCVILMAQGYTMYDFSGGVGRCILIDDSTHV